MYRQDPEKAGDLIAKELEIEVEDALLQMRGSSGVREKSF